MEIIEKEMGKTISASVVENDLINNIAKIHTTEMGAERIKQNLGLGGIDVVAWCREKILDKDARIEKKGKNWYVTVDNSVITVNAGSYTIITAHRKKK